MIRDRISRFLRNYLAPEPPDLDRSSNADPTLVNILNDGLDREFHDGRDQAVEKLDTLDIAAFWLQTVGDGSPLETADHDTLETETPHRMAWEAGFDDTLDYQEVSRISHQLFAHHIGIMVTPTSGSVSDRAALDNFLQPSVDYANSLYGEPEEASPEQEDWENVQYPRPRSLDDALESGRSLLETESLAYFWLQVLCDVEDSSFVMQIGGTPSDTPDVFVNHTIEYVVGIPRALEPSNEMNLNFQSLAQHLSYGARVTDESIEEFSKNALEMGLDLGYLHDSPNPP